MLLGGIVVLTLGGRKTVASVKQDETTPNLDLKEIG
ncbi:hypothetical protein UACE39S_05082 [Ureibacillus acetophenoni]